MIQENVNALIADNFNEDYFKLHNVILKNGDFIESRNGDTRELLNFKTIITDPTKRCIGGYDRNINIFFLLAEALWIWSGRRDVAFLDIFNSKMKNYSDNGKYFHAPYGWRLRNYGIDSMIDISEENKHAFQGLDQIKISLEALNNNPADRRVVCSIWNPELDLMANTSDKPCNDLLMFKIRNGKLCQTIQNRSNDLNWGLTTNVFQFSFIGEIMSKILGVELGDQVHNSQSLHIYLSEDLTTDMLNNIAERRQNNEEYLLYDFARPLQMDFRNMENLSINDKLINIDYFVKSIISTLMDKNAKGEEHQYWGEFEDDLKGFSSYLTIVNTLLKIYVEYKRKERTRLECLNLIFVLGRTYKCLDSDIIILALNFFANRIMKGKDVEEKENLKRSLQTYSNNGLEAWDKIGKL